MINIIGKRYWYFLLSALIIVPGLVSLLLPGGLLLGIDFTGGTLWEIQFNHQVEPAIVRSVFTDQGLDATVQTSGQNTVTIRTKEIRADSPQKNELAQAIKDRPGLGDFTELEFNAVGPAIGSEIAQRAIVAVALASIGILIYIWLAFRRLPNAFRFGACAIAALVHDAFVVLGTFSILGRLFGVEMDSMFVTAILTVIGFSVHDTIVVFDRIRENALRHPGEPFEIIVNHSLLPTLGRSISTSLTVVFTIAALVLFGGVTTRIFALTLLIGIISGTYSSIFNASPLLVVWENGEVGKLFRKLRPAPAAG